MVGAVLKKIIALARSNKDLDGTNLPSFARKLIIQNCPDVRGESQSAVCLSSRDVQLARAIVKRCFLFKVQRQGPGDFIRQNRVADQRKAQTPPTCDQA